MRRYMMLALVCLGISFGVQAQFSTYDLIEIGEFTDDETGITYSSSASYGFNNLGQVTGKLGIDSSFSADESIGFIWDQNNGIQTNPLFHNIRSITDSGWMLAEREARPPGEPFVYRYDNVVIDPSGAIYNSDFTEPTNFFNFVDINNSGVVVEDGLNGILAIEPEHWETPRFWEIGDSPYVIEVADSGRTYDINNLGDIPVGNTILNYRTGSVSQIPGIDSVRAVNDARQALGTSNNNRILFYDGSNTHTIVSLEPGSRTGSLYLNGVGEVLGSYEHNGITNHFLYRNGVRADITSLVPELNSLEDILLGGHNDSGQIILSGTTNGQRRSFLLNPVGELRVGSVSTLDPSATRLILPDIPEPTVGAIGKVLIVHGWNSDGSWAYDLAQSIDTNEDWDVEVLDWSTVAASGTPTEVADYALDMGTVHGEFLKQQDYEVVHVITHSAGAWTGQRIAEKLKDTSIKVHVTFLDAYQPEAWGRRLGISIADDLDNSVFMEHYQDTRFLSQELYYGEAFGLGAAGQEIRHAFNHDVTEEDSRLLLNPLTWLQDWHAWPYIWYSEESSGSGLGLDLAPIFRDGDLISHSTEGFGRKSDPVEIFWLRHNQNIDISDLVSTEGSDSGSVSLAGGDLSMTVGSPVWFAGLVTIDEPMNLLRFDADFVEVEGSEGLLSVFWDDVLLGTIDERFDDEGVEEYSYLLSHIYAPGDYTLAFRLDPFTEAESQVVINDINLGYLEIIPEPGSLFVLSFGSLILFRRR